VANASALQHAFNVRKEKMRIVQEMVKSTLTSTDKFHLQYPFEVLSVEEYQKRRSQEKMRLVGHIVKMLPTSEVYERCPLPNCSNEKLLMIPSPTNTEMKIWKCSAKPCGYLISLKDGIPVTKVSVSSEITSGQVAFKLNFHVVD
jgi:hypothetical protein